MKETNKPTQRRKGGRPSRDDAEKINGRILDAATDLFFTLGYGVISVEAIAARAHVSKRTFYARFKNKAEVFRAVVQRVIERLSPSNVSSKFEEGSCEENLKRIAIVMLQATLRPEALALSRLIFAEASRFPELAEMAVAQGARQKAIRIIVDLFRREIKTRRIKHMDTLFAAEQFIQMVISLPQRQALTLGRTMTAREIEQWCQDTVTLFMEGCLGNNQLDRTKAS